MAKISVVLLADVESHGDLGRAVNALSLVKEAKEAGDHVELIFDGAAAGVPYLSEVEGHPSLRRRVEEGYQVVTF